MFEGGNRVTKGALPRFSIMNDVVATLSLQLLEVAETLTGTFRYIPSDPWAVTVELSSHTGASVTWTFARELLAQGRYEPVGDGDVHIWPCLGSDASAVVILELDPGANGVLLEASAREVNAFVEAALALVPAGTESARLDIDASLARLLSGSTAA
ncbi:MAG TPA: SsgA family sporulation/cell division regulator [Marmoricola sp.]|nr:SsgA family sporulation/cell division regulator [Marmoricola sp.]